VEPEKGDGGGHKPRRCRDAQRRYRSARHGCQRQRRKKAATLTPALFLLFLSSDVTAAADAINNCC
jgi:hypothetical protein